MTNGTKKALLYSSAIGATYLIASLVLSYYDPLCLNFPSTKSPKTRWSVKAHRQHSKHVKNNLKLPTHLSGLDVDEIDTDDSVMEVSSETERLFNKLFHVSQVSDLYQAKTHHSVVCSACGKLINSGIRYVCTQCGNFDMCDMCESEDSHPANHPLYVLPYHLPKAVVQFKLPRYQLPWQSTENLMLHSTGVARYLPNYSDYAGFDQNNLSDSAFFGLGSNEVAALYSQFLCLIDTTIDVDSSTTSPGYAQEGAISQKAFLELLPTSTGTLLDPLQVLMKLYDLNNDGYITFVDYLFGIDLLLNKPFNFKVIRFLDCLKKVPQQSTRNCRTFFENLFSCYLEASKLNFRRALNILSFDKLKYSKHQKTPIEPNTSLTHLQQADRHVQIHLDSLLYEPRSEIDPNVEFEPHSADPRVDAEISLLWHISARDFSSELFEGIADSADISEIISALQKKFLENEKMKGCLTAILEAAII